MYDPYDDMAGDFHDSDLPPDNDPMTPEDSDTDKDLYIMIA